MTAEYQPEHILGAMFELRNNQRIEEFVSKIIKEKGWSRVIEILKRARELDVIVPGWDIPLRKGVLRDGMIELLNLQDFAGLDTDFVDSFADLKVKSLDDLREQARERAFSLLTEQVKRGNTFFMDLDVMADTSMAVIVPDAIKARMREVERLGSTPHLYEIYSTYYGFTVLTSMVKREEAGVPEDIKENLLDIFGELGGVDEIKSKQLKFSPFAFTGCSGHLIVLLWNLLRFSIGGQKYKRKATDKLAELGDSRALGLLHSVYPYLPPKMTLGCIGGIGHPSSYEFFEQRSKGDMTKTYTLESISTIRHPRVIQLVEQRIDSVHLRSRTWKLRETIKVAGNTRLRKFIPFYENMRNHPRSSIKKLAENALRDVHPSFE